MFGFKIFQLRIQRAALSPPPRGATASQLLLRASLANLLLPAFQFCKLLLLQREKAAAAAAAACCLLLPPAPALRRAQWTPQQPRLQRQPEKRKLREDSLEKRKSQI